jgi:hypothetical protein
VKAIGVKSNRGGVGAKVLLAKTQKGSADSLLLAAALWIGLESFVCCFRGRSDVKIDMRTTSDTNRVLTSYLSFGAGL